LAAPLFCAIFIHNTLQNSLQKSLYFNLQNHQQIGIFSLSSERVNLFEAGGFLGMARLVYGPFFDKLSFGPTAFLLLQLIGPFSS
jgi:hypothetical protein